MPINPEPQCPLSFQLLVLSLSSSIYTFWAGVSFLMCQFYTSVNSWMSADLFLAYIHYKRRELDSSLLGIKWSIPYPLILLNTPCVPIFHQSVPTHSNLLLLQCCIPTKHPLMLLLKLCQGQCIPAASSMLGRSGINASSVVFPGAGVSRVTSISSLFVQHHLSTFSLAIVNCP